MSLLKVSSAVFFFLLCTFCVNNVCGALSVSPAFSLENSELRIFLSSLVEVYPSKTFALCMISQNEYIVVDHTFVSSADVCDELGLQSRQIVRPPEAAAIAPATTAFHVAGMAIGTGYHELPRPEPVVISPTVFNQSSPQQGAPTPNGKIRPSVPSSPWRSCLEEAPPVFFYIVTMQTLFSSCS